ncbi:MAG: hypothetical protein KatS3mg043_1108 [Rhodothermaceae bacterium]|nr:MAG: hypothetical protein KatS3mg043_1108 [Rhodothermaceae bacterium]
MTKESFSRWCRAYGLAWEARDPDTAAALFSPDACYYETPFATPVQGREAIRAYWEEAVRTQREINFSYLVLGVSGARGLAHWQASFLRVPGNARVQLDGILAVEMNEAGQCRTFREWWHRHETSPAVS